MNENPVILYNNQEHNIASLFKVLSFGEDLGEAYA